MRKHKPLLTGYSSVHWDAGMGNKLSVSGEIFLFVCSFLSFSFINDEKCSI